MYNAVFKKLIFFKIEKTYLGMGEGERVGSLKYFFQNSKTFLYYKKYEVFKYSPQVLSRSGFRDFMT